MKKNKNLINLNLKEENDNKIIKGIIVVQELQFMWKWK